MVGRKRPTLANPFLPIFTKTTFGQSILGHLVLDHPVWPIWCASWGPEGWGAQNFALFSFCRPIRVFFLFRAAGVFTRQPENSKQSDILGGPSEGGPQQQQQQQPHTKPQQQHHQQQHKKRIVPKWTVQKNGLAITAWRQKIPRQSVDVGDVRRVSKEASTGRWWRFRPENVILHSWTTFTS